MRISVTNEGDPFFSFQTESIVFWVDFLNKGLLGQKIRADRILTHHHSHQYSADSWLLFAVLSWRYGSVLEYHLIGEMEYLDPRNVQASVGDY